MLRQSKKFFVEIFKKNSNVGSITPSSRFLAKKMLQHIDFSKDCVIVEYGPGMGVFTKKIVEKLSANSRLYVFELNKEFFIDLQNEIKDKRVHLICDSAAKIKEYLAKDNIEHIDYIVSSLPLSLIPEEIREDIVLQSFNSLKKGGKMTQFQYSQQCKHIFKAHFSKLDTEFTLLNVPPAFVYVCEK